MPEANKAIVRRFLLEAFNKGNLKAVDDLIADDFIDHTAAPNMPRDKAGLKRTVSMARSAFPDLHLTIEDMLAEGNKVAVRVVCHGTQEGELMGIQPTGRSVSVNEEHIVRLANGRIAEHWGVEDTLGMLQQLGVLKGPMGVAASL